MRLASNALQLGEQGSSWGMRQVGVKAIPGCSSNNLLLRSRRTFLAFSRGKQSEELGRERRGD